MKFEPYEYQQRAIDFILTHKSAGLFLDMGLGKTVITLTAIMELIHNRFEVTRVLVIAPKRVAEDTWSGEAVKWDHLKGLQISLALGTQEQRKDALWKEADVYVIGRDNVQWLVEYCDSMGHVWPFDMLVVDELSSFKNSQAKRFKALRKMLPQINRVVGLTGTPSANGLMDLWAEMYLLDRGERLGKTITDYRQTYFRPGVSNGHVVYRWDPVKHAQIVIEKKISDICLSMNAKDYLQLPDRIDVNDIVHLSDQEMEVYRRMEKDAIVQTDNIDDQGNETKVWVDAFSAAAVMAKLLQMANGRVYGEKEEFDGGHVIVQKAVLELHRAKLERLQELVEAADGPVLIFYSYRHDIDAIKSVLPEVKELKSKDGIAEWNAGKTSVLLAHPASAGYGLNLQGGGHTIIWYGLTWSLEQYQQANARLHRQGQQKPVVVHHILAAGTVDEQVMRALKRKDTSQKALLEALKERRKNGDE